MFELRRPAGRSSRMLAVAVSLVLCLAACGGSGSTSTSTSSHSTATPAATRIRGLLHAQDHSPTVDHDWAYSVRVTDANGNPLNGSVAIEFVFAGQVVGRDTPPSHPVTDGIWHDKLKFPAQAIGMQLSFRAVVHTHLGSLTLDWPVKVRR